MAFSIGPTVATMQASTSTNPLVRKAEAFVSLHEGARIAMEVISGPVTDIAAHSDLVREGDKPRGVLMILNGMAYRYKKRTGGARQITAYLVPGDMGDLDVALLERMDHGIATFSACKVAWIKPETLSGIRQSHPVIDRALRIGTLVDEAILQEWIMNIGCRSAIERLAHLFCELLMRLQVVGRAFGNSYALPVSQAELADTTGLSNVHVNRSLQELRRRGLIRLSGKVLTVFDFPALKALAEFRPGYLHLAK